MECKTVIKNNPLFLQGNKKEDMGGGEINTEPEWALIAAAGAPRQNNLLGLFFLPQG